MMELSSAQMDQAVSYRNASGLGCRCAMKRWRFRCAASGFAADEDLAVLLARLVDGQRGGRGALDRAAVRDAELGAVPGTGDDTVLDFALGERASSVGAPVLQRVELAGLVAHQQHWRLADLDATVLAWAELTALHHRRELVRR